tara:strand:+ start:453 stop:647 length:195 start_codon:yes stop_codon:yes gene_type:complete
MFLFIVGTGRNGTKLLMEMLNQQPKFGILMESHYLPILIDIYQDKEISAKVFYDYAINHFETSK